jgi:peptidoglycan hydrolase CwlO-like protein
MRKNKRKDMHIVIPILIATIVVIGISVYFKVKNAQNYNKSTSNTIFYENKKREGKILFDKIMDVDFEYEYPETVEKLMDIYLSTRQLMYGDLLIENSDIHDVIIQQRNMFSDELLENNSLTSQVDNLMNHIDSLNEEGVRLISSNIDYVSRDLVQVMANIKENYSKIGTVRSTIVIQKDNNNLWKIMSWEVELPTETS